MHSVRRAPAITAVRSLLLFTQFLGSLQVLRLILRVCMASAPIGVAIVGFKEAHFEPQGYTAVWILAESHLAVHTFPEAGRTYCELASCNREKFVAYLSLMEPLEVN